MATGFSSDSAAFLQGHRVRQILQGGASGQYKGLTGKEPFLKLTPRTYLAARCGQVSTGPKSAEVKTCREKAAKTELNDPFRIGSTSEATALEFVVSNGKVEYVDATFAGKDFGTVAAALEEKYGAPKYARVENVQNKAGANFKSVSKTWVLADGVIFLEQMKYDSLESMWLRMESPAMEEFKREQGAKRAKDAAKGL